MGLIQPPLLAKVISGASRNQLASSTEVAAEPLVQAAAYSTANLANTYVKAVGADRVWTEWPYYTGSNVRLRWLTAAFQNILIQKALHNRGF